MTARERMSGVDTAWWRMDRASNRMMIVAVLVFAGPMSVRRLRTTVRARLLRYRRFAQRVAEDASGYWWEDDRDFDLARHVSRARLSGKCGPAELRRLAARLAAKPLDPRHPLWEFTVVENYGGRAALVARIHHAIADGIALVGVLLSLTDDAPHRPLHGATRARRRAAPAADDGGIEALLAPVAQMLKGAVRLSGGALERSLQLLRHPAGALDYARIATRVAEDVAALATMPDDSPTRLRGQPGVHKVVAWSAPLPLVEVKAAGRALGCSVNDVLLSSVAGAIGGYLASKGDPVAGVEVRAMVPVNMRPPGAPDGLGNRFGLVPLVLPVGITNPFRRLYDVHERMEALKGSYVAALSLGLLEVAGLLPAQVQQEVVDLLANKASAVMTNVPGPQSPLYLAGRRIDEMMFWVPQSGNIGVGVSILSYNGGVQFGLITDRRLVPDPERIVGRFRSEFETLLLALLMEPWGARRHPDAIERDLAAALRAARRRAPPPGAAPDAGAPD
ncbi:MAG: wax ester/triacylglycerol synthase family O-acyltransferase [Burkholderiales bacterium]|nr:wax ester/triacylglycerol synthase family O-acyltransferase [Burkholderiales bacterium]